MYWKWNNFKLINVKEKKEEDHKKSNKLYIQDLKIVVRKG